MMRLLRTVRLLLARHPWQPAEPWQPADARALGHFLQTAAGQKLLRTLTAEIASANERAALSRGGAFECGWACGYRGLLAWVQALAAVEPTAPGDDETETFSEELTND